MTAVFEQHGIRIQYPENWNLQQHEAKGHALEIQIVAPSGAFWSLLAFDKKVDADHLMTELLSGINKQYDSAEWTPVAELIGKFNATGYDSFFFYLDLLVSNQMRCLESGNHKLLLTYQAENREFESIAPVFKAITFSMLSNLSEAKRFEFGQGDGAKN